MSDEHFLGRWSRRKSVARAGGALPAEPAVPPAPPAAASAALPPASVEPVEPPALPPVDSLTGDSDFAPFMQAGVDPQTRRDALKVLLRDPRFNVMDGLDVYIDDYSKPDPLPEGWLEKLNQFAYLGDATPAPVEEAANGEEKPGARSEPGQEPEPQRVAQTAEDVVEAAPAAAATGVAAGRAPDDAS